jgi:hypothetical protein
MDKLNKAVIIMAKIAEVIHWIGAALMAVLAVMFAVGKGDNILDEVDAVSLGSDFTMYGFNIDEATGGNLTGGSMLVIFLTGLITCILMAMVFRNVYLIFKTAEGKTSDHQHGAAADNGAVFHPKHLLQSAGNRNKQSTDTAYLGQGILSAVMQKTAKQGAKEAARHNGQGIDNGSHTGHKITF